MDERRVVTAPDLYCATCREQLSMEQIGVGNMGSAQLDWIDGRIFCADRQCVSTGAVDRDGNPVDV